MWKTASASVKNVKIPIVYNVSMHEIQHSNISIKYTISPELLMMQSTTCRWSSGRAIDISMKYRTINFQFSTTFSNLNRIFFLSRFRLSSLMAVVIYLAVWPPSSLSRSWPARRLLLSAARICSSRDTSSGENLASRSSTQIATERNKNDDHIQLTYIAWYLMIKTT